MATEIELDAQPRSSVGWLQRISSRLTALLPVPKYTLPTESDPFTYTMNAPQKTWRCGFEAAVASGPDTAFFTAIANGTGITVSQAGGSLLVASGTTTYAETILRSVPTFSAGMTVRYSMNLSQRIANQQFYIELVDVIGDGLAFVVNSATSVTVTIPGTTLTSANVGQSMYLGALSLAACPGGRYVIASVSGTAITFTVAAFPASGSGTCSVFGWNFHHTIYDGTTATTCLYDTARTGYSSGDTTATINTSASPGHVVTWPIRDSTAGLLDELSASSTTLENTLRASRVRNVPEDLTALRVQIRCINLASAPGSTTTLTIGFIEIENFVSQQVSIVNVSPLSLNSALPVQVANTPNVGTVSTLSAITAGANLIADVGQQYRATATGAASSSHLVSAATTNATVIKGSAGRMLGWTLSNTSAAAKYVKFHNTSAAPTPGAGVVRTILVPTLSTVSFKMEGGIAHSTGIGMTITGAAADADTTAVAAGDVIADVFFA